MWHRLYLYRVFTHSKLLFTFFLLFVFGTLISAYRTQEQFPFLLYGMYSQKEFAQANYTTYRMEISGQPIIWSNLPDAQHELIQTTLLNAIGLRESNRINDAEWEKFMRWLFVYSADMRMIDENVMSIYEVNCRYVNGNLVKDSEKQIYRYDGAGE